MGWIDTISDSIESAFDSVRSPFPSVPSILLASTINQQPGLSAISLTSAIIERLPEAGIPTGVNADGSPNVILQFVRIVVEELINEIKENAKVSCALPPATITSYGTGTSPAGTVVVTSQNIGYAPVEGIVI